MASSVVALRDRYRPAALAGAGIALAGTAIAFATLGLTANDHLSPPTYTLAGLDVDWSLLVRTAVQTTGLITMSVICGAIVWRRPRALLSYLFVWLVAFLLLQAAAGAYAVHGLLVAPGSLPLADLAAWSQSLTPDLGLLGGVVFLLLFPDGRLKSPRWRLLVSLAVVYFVADMVSALDEPYPLRVGMLNMQWVPVALPPAVWPVGFWLSGDAAVLGWARPALGLLLAIYLLRRLSAAHGDGRLQLKWFAYAVSVYVGTFLLGLADNPPPLDWLPSQVQTTLQQFVNSETAHAIGSWSNLLSSMAGLILLPGAIAVAMVRYRLYDIDLVINRTILYGGLALFVTGAYAVGVAGLGSLLGQRGGLNPFLTILTIAFVAALLLPARSRLQALANAAVYGKRARPYDVLSEFADGISRAEPADVLLPRMADLLRDGTGAARTEVWVRLGDHLQLAASSPPPERAQPALSTVEEVKARLGADALAETVVQDGAMLGALVLAKPRGEALTSIERRLFHDLAAQAGLVLARFRLVQELRESRSRIVAAQDAERQRIERNLHDGAQQRFVNALLALGMADADMEGGGSRAELIEEASREVRAGLKDMRALARGLEPPLLAEAGIAAAVSDLVDRAPIPITTTFGDLQRYPSGIETTTYFVVAEALTNAAKHSDASSIKVSIAEAGGRLRVEVADDGVGGAAAGGGTGIIGLQDRVAALGGRLTVESPVGAGTRVVADLPCA